MDVAVRYRQAGLRRFCCGLIKMPAMTQANASDWRRCIGTPYNLLSNYYLFDALIGLMSNLTIGETRS